MEYKAIIFDLDGTLLNILDDLGDSVNAILETYGYPTYTSEQYRLMIGNGARSLIEKSLPEGLPYAVIDQALSMFKTIYSKRYMNKTQPYEGITEMLEELRQRQRHVKLSVCSNKHNAATKALVETLLPKNLFACVYGERLGVPRKPDPTSVLEIAKQMDISPCETLYVGDSMVDMITGHNAKMLSVGVLWGFRSKQELVENGADVILSHPSELFQKVSLVGNQ